jgi:quercetin dioxygenase-like cupin family protein
LSEPIFFPASDRPQHQIRPDLLGTVIPAEHGTLVRWSVKARQPETPIHSHNEFEQITVILEGQIKTRVGDQVFTLSPGDVLRIDRGAPHGNTTALGDHDAIVLDIFMPPRAQYLNAAKRSSSDG